MSIHFEVLRYGSTFAQIFFVNNAAHASQVTDSVSEVGDLWTDIGNAPHVKNIELQQHMYKHIL